MELITDPLKQYQQIFHNFFEKVKSLLDKKQSTQFEDLFESHKTEIVSERQKIGLSANKHYILFYKLLKLQNVKITELCLYHIEKLVQYKFLTGNCPDYITNAGDNFNFHIDQVKKVSQQEFKNKVIQQQQEQNQNNYHYRKLYYCIIESICECCQLKEDSVNLKVIQCLQHLMTCSSCEIHGEPVNLVIRTIIDIHSMNKSQVLHNLSSNALLQIIHVLFMRMEQTTKLSEEERKTFRNKKSDPSNMIGPAGPLPANNLQQLDTSFHSNNSLVEGLNTGSSSLINNSNIIQNQVQDGEQQQGQNSLQTSKILYNYYVKKVLVQCIDDVCLNSEKHKLVDELADQLYRDKSEDQKQDYIQQEKSLIPLRSAPLLKDAGETMYQQYKIVDIYNEQDIKSGKFGWCFICRNTANNFCKDTRVPICSGACKMTHLEELDKLSRISEESQGYFHDSLKTFQTLAQLSLTDNQHLSPVELKKKILVLETLLSMLESAGPVFLSKKEFVDLMKNNLVNSLLQNCLSSEKSIMMLSFSLIVSLIQNFRENLKSEIAVFVQDVLLRLLQSNNSDFNHRKYTLEVFHKIFKVPRAILELYVNYDCCLGEVSLVENVTGMLTKIAQGKYKKQEYSTLILPPQESELKVKAVEALKELVQKLCDFVDQCEQGILNQQNLDEDNEEIQYETTQKDSQISETLDNQFDRVEKEKLKKQHIVKAIQRFNLKAKNGVQYLIKNQIIEKDDCKGLSQIFFDYNEQINQEILGQFLGNVSDFNQGVLSEFTDLMDFRDLKIDQAMRIFLTYFQLPGEAQQVDRIMQKFGEKFMNDNAHNTYLKNGGVAYVLSYSLMMLQTSHHNPQVQEKDKISLQAFKNMIKGINEEDGVKEDIADEEVERMFNEIRQKALAVHKDQDRNDLMEQALNTNMKEKQDLFQKETHNIVQEGQNKIKKEGNGQYTQVFSLEYLKSLMQEIWTPLFASFTRIYEESDEKNILEVCLEGMVYCIKLLGISDMPTEKGTFLFYLTKNSNLLDNNNQHYINEKNIMCIKGILNCALIGGNYLNESWKDVVKCLSQLDYYHLVKSKINGQATQGGKNKNQKEAMIEINNSEMICQNIDPGMIDKVFHQTHNLKPESIKIFIKCLCDLSKEELKNQDNPRIFYMQRISEVTGFNMKRVKYNWSEIWSNLSKFFTEAGTHINPQIAELSVDFLKQLALKFLEQKELKHFTFQKDFLAPFEQIYINMKINNAQLKEFIIACIYMLTNQAFHNLKSGWKIILRVLNWSIQDNQPNLLQVSFMIIQKIMHENLDAVLEVMVELVQALTQFGKGQNPQYAVNCIQHIKTCLDYLIKNANKVVPDQVLSDQLSKAQHSIKLQEIQQEKYLQQECKKHLESLWIPIMSTLASLFEKDVRGVQRASMECLFKILRENGKHFSEEFWKQALRSVLRPLFDEISFCFSKKNFTDDELYLITKKSAATSFEKFQDIIIEFFGQLSANWDEIIEIFKNCIINQVDSLVNLATSTLVRVLEGVGSKLNKEQWESVIQLILDVQTIQIFDTEKLCSLNPEFSENFLDIMPSIPNRQRPNFHLNLNKCTRLCITQLMLIKTQQKIFDLFSQHFDDQQLMRWKQLAFNVYHKAEIFNDMLYLRYSLWKSGLMADMYIVPGLFKHYKEAFTVYLEISYEQYRREQSQENLKMFMRIIIKYMQKYSSLIQEQMEKTQEEYRLENGGRRRKSITLQDSQNNLDQEPQKKNTFNQGENHSVADLKQMFMIEFERKISSMKQVISNFIFQHLNSIPTENLDHQDLQDISNILIDISSFSGDQNGYQNQQQSYDVLLKQILKNYFAYAMSQMRLKSNRSSYELMENRNNNNNNISEQTNENNKLQNQDQVQEQTEIVQEQQQEQLNQEQIQQDNDLQGDDNQNKDTEIQEQQESEQYDNDINVENQDQNQQNSQEKIADSEDLEDKEQEQEQEEN